MLELCCDDILLRLGRKSACLTLQAMTTTACLVEVLGQLLCDGTTATLTALAQDYGHDAGTRRSLEVDARVVEEAYILCGEECSYDRGQLVAVNL